MSIQHTVGDEYDDAWSEIDDERDELQVQDGKEDSPSQEDDLPQIAIPRRMRGVL